MEFSTILEQSIMWHRWSSWRSHRPQFLQHSPMLSGNFSPVLLPLPPEHSLLHHSPSPSQSFSTPFLVWVLATDGEIPNPTLFDLPSVKVHCETQTFPMTARYTFTDYWSQGQTLPYVIIDIASPPSGSLLLFTLYVALLRCLGRAMIRLLWDIDEEAFKTSHNLSLLEEDERLEKLNALELNWIFHRIATMNK